MHPPSIGNTKLAVIKENNASAVSNNSNDIQHEFDNLRKRSPRYFPRKNVFKNRNDINNLKKVSKPAVQSIAKPICSEPEEEEKYIPCDGNLMSWPKNSHSSKQSRRKRKDALLPERSDSPGPGSEKRQAKSSVGSGSDSSQMNAEDDYAFQGSLTYDGDPTVAPKKGGVGKKGANAKKSKTKQISYRIRKLKKVRLQQKAVRTMQGVLRWGIEGAEKGAAKGAAIASSIFRQNEPAVEPSERETADMQAVNERHASKPKPPARGNLWSTRIDGLHQYRSLLDAFNEVRRGSSDADQYRFDADYVSEVAGLAKKRIAELRQMTANSSLSADEKEEYEKALTLTETQIREGVGLACTRSGDFDRDMIHRLRMGFANLLKIEEADKKFLEKPKDKLPPPPPRRREGAVAAENNAGPRLLDRAIREPSRPARNKLKMPADSAKGDRVAQMERNARREETNALAKRQAMQDLVENYWFLQSVNRAVADRAYQKAMDKTDKAFGTEVIDSRMREYFREELGNTGSVKEIEKLAAWQPKGATMREQMAYAYHRRRAQKGS